MEFQLTIGSCVGVRSSRYEAHGKFGEHERCVRVAKGVAESNSRVEPIRFYNIFQRGSLNVFSRHLFADVISVHNGNIQHARATEFDYTNLLDML